MNNALSDRLQKNCCLFCNAWIDCEHRVSEKELNQVRVFQAALLDLAFGGEPRGCKLRHSLESDWFNISLFSSGEAQIVSGRGYAKAYKFSLNPSRSVRKILDNLFERGLKEMRRARTDDPKELGDENEIKKIYGISITGKPHKHRFKYLNADCHIALPPLAD